MDSPRTPEIVGTAQALPQAQIKTLLVLDMVDSTGMIERLGDLKASERIRRHDRFVRDLVKVHGGREIDKTDGFLLLFDRPVQAAAFALTYQRALKDNPELPIHTRIGLHVGEVVLFENSVEDIAAGAKAVELEGLAKPIAARLMSLALPGQILISDFGHALISRGFSELQQRFSNVQLRDHGIWHLKGVHEAMHVHELGEPGVAPFTRPIDVEKVHHDRRRMLLGMAASIGTLSVGAGSWWWWRNRPISIPFEKRDWVVVGEFINETGQELLDDSLDQAFRIGLEQSQFVNTVPDPQVRDSLKRMRTQAEHPLRDRQVLCEVALRENARAVVLPRVSNKADRILVTSELIEPHSQRAVAIDTAEAAGFTSVVVAVDQLVRSLRERFGETRPKIDQDTLPLAQVTSADLEALRSYSLGLKSFTQGEYEEARVLLEHAIKLDAEFAAAFAKLSGIHFVMGRLREARAAAEKAAAVRDRLTPREKLYVEGTLTFDQPPSLMLEKWALLARMFPDFKIGQHNCGFVEWQFQNRYADALRWLQPVAYNRFPQQPVTLNILGYALLGDEQYEAADLAFRTAQEISGSHYAFGRADSLMCLGKDAQVSHLLQAQRPASKLFGHYFDLRQIMLMVFQGRLAATIPVIHASMKQASGPGQLARLRYIELTIAEIQQDPRLQERLEHAVALELAAFERDPLDLDYAPQFLLALLAAMLVRQGNPDDAQAIAARIQSRCMGSGYFFRERAFALLEAELALQRGDLLAVEASLLPLSEGRRLIAEDELRQRLTHAGQPSSATVSITALAARMGRALAEWNEGFAQQVRNVWSVLAAQVAMIEQDPLTHSALHNRLLQRWRDADDLALAKRLRDISPAA